MSSTAVIDQCTRRFRRWLTSDGYLTVFRRKNRFDLMPTEEKHRRNRLKSEEKTSIDLTKLHIDNLDDETLVNEFLGNSNREKCFDSMNSEDRFDDEEKLLLMNVLSFLKGSFRKLSIGREERQIDLELLEERVLLSVDIDEKHSREDLPIDWHCEGSIGED